MKVGFHSIGAGLAQNRRSILRAALPRAYLPSVREVCRVRAQPQNRPSSRDVRHRDLRPGHGVLHQAEERRDGSARNHGSSMPRVIQRRATNPPATPVTRTGDGLKRAGDRGGMREFQRYASIHRPPRWPAIRSERREIEHHCEERRLVEVELRQRRYDRSCLCVFVQA